jgi:hypothetical protein
MFAANIFHDLEMLGGGAALGALGFVLFGLAIPYLVLSLRDGQNEQRDPEIGLKSALYFMFSLSVLLVLAGLTAVVVDALDERYAYDLTEAQRNGFAMIISGIAFGLFHLFIIMGFTNDRRFPATRRVFVGCRLAVHGLVVMTTFTILVIQVFQPSIGFKELRPILGVLMVWGPSWIVHLVLLRIYRSNSPSRLRRRVDEPRMDD